MISLEESEHGYEAIPKSDCIERSLWRAVVLQCIEDATRHALGLHILKTAGSSDGAEDGADAFLMIKRNEQDWQTICHYADLDPDMARDRTLKFIADNRK